MGSELTLFAPFPQPPARALCVRREMSRKGNSKKCCTMPCQGCVEAMKEVPPFSWMVGQDMHQCVIFGLRGSGKTTLLYKLKIPSWKRTDIIRDMHNMKGSKNQKNLPEGEAQKERITDEDPGYHYEELYSSSLGNYGVWEIPGNEVMMKQWPLFYRYLNISAVFFVVDMFSADRAWQDVEKILEARNKIMMLLNEDELRTSAFFLVLNTDERNVEDVSREERHAMEEVLGVPDIMSSLAHKERFFVKVLHCAEIQSWEDVCKDIRTVYKSFGPGAAS